MTQVEGSGTASAGGSIADVASADLAKPCIGVATKALKSPVLSANTPTICPKSLIPFGIREGCARHIDCGEVTLCVEEAIMTCD